MPAHHCKCYKNNKNHTGERKLEPLTRQGRFVEHEPVAQESEVEQ